MATAVRKPRSSGGGLAKKLGPLPLWAWVAIAAAGIVAGVYLKRHLSASTQQSTQSASPDTSTVGTTYPDLGGATSGGAAGSGIAPNEFADFGALLGTLESAGLLGGQQAPPQTGTPQFTINEPAISLPAPVVTYVTAPASSHGGKTTTSGPPQAVSPIIQQGGQQLAAAIPYIASLPAATTGDVYASPTPQATINAIAAAYGGGSADHVVTPTASVPKTAAAVAAARPGGVSSNKQQGVYSIH